MILQLLVEKALAAEVLLLRAASYSDALVRNLARLEQRLPVALVRLVASVSNLNGLQRLPYLQYPPADATQAQARHPDPATAVPPAPAARAAAAHALLPGGVRRAPAAALSGPSLQTWSRSCRTFKGIF